MTPLECRFLQYAYSVVQPPANHLASCISESGATTLKGLDATLRWPGYIGERYLSASYRLLCVAQVHHALDLERTLGGGFRTIC